MEELPGGGDQQDDTMHGTRPHPSDAAPHTPPETPHVTRPRFVAAALAAAGVALLVVAGTARPMGRSTIGLVLLVVGFLASESLSVRVEIRRHTHLISFGGLVLLVGVASTSAESVGVASVIGGGAALLARRTTADDLLWHVAVLLARAGAATAIAAALVDPSIPETALGWIGVLAGVAAAEAVGVAAICVRSALEGSPPTARLVAEIAQTHGLGLVASTYGVVAVTAVHADRWMVPFAILPVIAFAAFARGTGELRQRHRDLQRFHTFTTALTSDRVDRTVDTGLAEIVDILHAASGGIVTLGEGDDAGGVRRFDAQDGTFADLAEPDLAASLARCMHGDGVTALSDDDPNPAVRDALERLGAASVLAAPTLTGADRRGILFVGDPSGNRRVPTRAELRLFGSMAAAFSARLSYDLLTDRLRSQAHHDPLTGLVNRIGFESELEHAIAEHPDGGAVVVLDVDHLAGVNRTLGRHAGDEVLTAVARRIRTLIGDTGVVARSGDDEFCVLVPDADADGRWRVVEEIRRVATGAVPTAGASIELGVRLGAATWPSDGDHPAVLLRRAESALRSARERHLASVWYDPELDVDSVRRAELSRSVGEALDTGQFTVVYQPKVSIRSGDVTGVEAFARWRHHQLGDVPPVEFVPLLDEAGLGPALTRFVLAEAVRAASRLEMIGDFVPVAVNVSGRDLLDPAFPTEVERLVTAAAIPPALLRIEVTEDALVADVDASARVLDQLHRLGVGISIDDFGTGYAALVQLDRLPVDELKIDRSFIARMDRDPGAAAIVKASIGLGNELGLNTVAEGVEDGAMVRALADLGCHDIQGYLIGRPRSLDEIAIWVEAWCGDPLVGWLRTVGDAGMLLDMAR